jgi:hypothetical protein
MPPFKPMKLRDYERWIARHGWTLKKGSIDWSLLDQSGKMAVRQIKVTHPGREVDAHSVKKTEKALKAASIAQEGKEQSEEDANDGSNNGSEESLESSRSD